MIPPDTFDESLRRLLTKDKFVPFSVELDDGQQILIQEPALAFGGGYASFIDPVEGALVDFSHKEVREFHAPARR